MNRDYGKPWYEKRQLDPAFPFRMGHGNMGNFPLHWHELVEIAMVIQGELEILYGDSSLRCRAGDIVIINSGEIHGYRETGQDGRKGNEMFLFQFGLSLFDSTVADLRDTVSFKSILGGNHLLVRDDGALGQQVWDLLIDISREFDAKGQGYKLAVRARLYDLVLALMRSARPESSRRRPSKTVKRRNQTLDTIYRFIHENFQEDLGLDDVAGVTNLSKFYLTRFFKEQTGQTVFQYIAHVRVGHAIGLLATTDLPITQIAFSSGFSNLKTFNRVFRQISSCSPSQYKKALFTVL